MATIKPFKGVRYALDKTGPLKDLITPPYDVISEAEQKRLYSKHRFNIIRLERSQSLPGESGDTGRFTRAKSFLESALKEGVLAAEEKPAYYFYEQEFSYGFKKYTRRGLFAAVKTEDYAKKVILPHENTFAAAKAERLKLLSALESSVSPVFMLYPGGKDFLQTLLEAKSNLTPLFNVESPRGEKHRFYALTGLDLQEQITAFFKDKPLLIADGHHRYDTALTYSKRTDVKGTGKNFCLAVLVSFEDPGLLVLPTHRLLDPLSKAQEEALAKIIKTEFYYKRFAATTNLDEKAYLKELSLQEETAPALGVISKDEAGFLQPKKDFLAGTLSLNILHENLLKPLGKIKVSYLQQVKSAKNKLLEESAGRAFILNPTRLAVILEKARQGELMPEKSTYFYPKLPTGLVLYHHHLSL